VTELRVLCLAVLLLAAAATPLAAQTAGDPLARFKASIIEPPEVAQLAVRRSVYVPVYSSLVGSGGQARLDLAVTLSVRNVSATLPLVVESIDYFDTAGHPVEHYLKKPIAIRPLGTIEILIPTDDVRGGTGAKFVVGWAATAAIAEPVIESIMVGATAGRGYSFTAPGRTIQTVGP
jgi:hypothetical protein